MVETVSVEAEIVVEVGAEVEVDGRLALEGVGGHMTSQVEAPEADIPGVEGVDMDKARRQQVRNRRVESNTAVVAAVAERHASSPVVVPQLLHNHNSRTGRFAQKFAQEVGLEHRLWEEPIGMRRQTEQQRPQPSMQNSRTAAQVVGEVQAEVRREEEVGGMDLA